MAACSAPSPLVIGEDDRRLDAVWVAIARGDVAEAERVAASIEDPEFRRRASRDVGAAVAGRSAALVACVEDGDWLAARFDAADRRAEERLRALGPELEEHPAVRLERARRASSAERRMSLARAARDAKPGGPEALALECEALLARREPFEVLDRLERRADRTARLTLALRRAELDAGLARRVCEGVLRDLERGDAVPWSLALLEQGLARVPMRDIEERAREVLEGTPIVGSAMVRARERTAAWLAALEGRVGEAVARLETIRPRWPDDDRRLRRWRVRTGEEIPGHRLERLDVAFERVADPEFAWVRLADEWGLAARAHYELVPRGEAASDFDAFLDRLDTASAPLGAPLQLGEQPRRDYGWFGEMLDSERLLERVPDALILGGKALGLPPELAWYDVERCRRVPLPELDDDYTECLVRGYLVPGYLTSLGARFTGAGLDRIVFLDLDQLEVRERLARVREVPPRRGPLEAVGERERRSLDEPLDVALRLDGLVLEDDPSAFHERLLESLSLHERRHILDAREFLDQSLAERFWSLAGAGLLPGAVRAELERRAQLQALREAEDPRLPLAHAISFMPVQQLGRADEHSLGYHALLRQFVEVLDSGRVVDPLEYGISRRHNLLQQLDRLPPGAVRAIALALPD